MGTVGVTFEDLIVVCLELWVFFGIFCCDEVEDANRIANRKTELLLQFLFSVLV